MEEYGCGGAILSTHCLNPTQHPWLKQIATDHTRILLIQRGMTAPTFPGYWAMPAGLAETSESTKLAAEREIQEELGIKFRAEDIFYEGKWENRYLTYFIGRWVAPENITIQASELSGYGWFTLSEALSLPLAFRYVEAINALRSRLNAG